jgi:hypothetical protein
MTKRNIKVKKMLIEKNAVTITGGVGDWIVIDSFLTDEERARIKTIYWATKTRRISQQLFFGVAKQFFPNLKKQVVVWDQFDLFHSFHRASHVHKITTPPRGFDQSQDLSIYYAFPRILEEKIPFYGSCLLRCKLANIDHFKLPKKYVCIVAGTSNNDGLRNFTLQEWASVLKWLIHTNQVGVALGSPDLGAPFETSCLINLIGKTTPVESTEILKNAYSTILVDSWLSLLASQLFESEQLMVKSKNTHLFSYKSLYYAPRTSFDFISKNILPMTIDPLLRSYPSTEIDMNLEWCYLHDIFYHPNFLNFKVYDETYFEKYKVLEVMSMANSKPIDFRIKLVNKYCKESPVLDIGVGTSPFISRRKEKTYGFDICEPVVKRLKQEKHYFNPWISSNKNIRGYCFWDSFQLISHPSLLLSQLTTNSYVFISMPVMSHEFLTGDGPNIATRLSNWKHYHPDEYIHYWTNNGLKNYMNSLGFSCLEELDDASDKDIKTFVFVKKDTRS